jgi:hypothetical protein
MSASTYASILRTVAGTAETRIAGEARPVIAATHASRCTAKSSAGLVVPTEVDLGGSGSIDPVSRARRKVLHYVLRHKVPREAMWYAGRRYVRRRLPSARKMAAGAVATGAAVVAVVLARRVRARSLRGTSSSPSVRYNDQVDAAATTDTTSSAPATPISP